MTDSTLTDQAREMGRDAARSALTWVELSESDARSIVDDVDPEVMDRYNGPNLSGEWAGESIPEIFSGFPDPWDSEIHDAWTEAADETWSEGLDALATAYLTG